MKIDQKENLCNTRITDFMASAKQIAWRKKFARMSKAGKFRKKTHAGFKAKSDSMSAKTKRASGYTLDEWEKRNKKSKSKKSNPHNSSSHKSAWDGLRKDYLKKPSKTPTDLVNELMSDQTQGRKGAFWRGSYRVPFYIKSNKPTEDIIVVTSEDHRGADGDYYISKRNLNQTIFDV